MNRAELTEYLEIAEGAAMLGRVISCARYIGSALACTVPGAMTSNPDLAIRAHLVRAEWSLEDGNMDDALKNIRAAKEEVAA